MHRTPTGQLIDLDNGLPTPPRPGREERLVRVFVVFMLVVLAGAAFFNTCLMR